MIGVVLLAHEQLWRTAQLAKHLTREGVRVVVHIDARVGDEELGKLHTAMGGSTNLAFAPRKQCDWGTFSLVEASLASLRLLMTRWPDVTHVVQLSGSCLPIKPIAALEQHLAANQGVDFIEMKDVEVDPWVVDGLSIERFTLYHPLPWRKYRRSFDFLVAVQRRLGINRKLPNGLRPHIGSQWWCLSAQTVRAILEDPDLDKYCDYFRLTWIPDESFFQTLAAKHSTSTDTTPLTFVRFDPQGKPYVFYDDHLDLLLHAEGYFARKIWRGSNQLYRVFLNKDLDKLLPGKSDGGRLTARFERAQNRHKTGRRGLISQGRHRGRRSDRQHETAVPYMVIDGLERLCPEILSELNSQPDVIAHGDLYHPDRVELVDGAEVFTGNLCNSVPIRNHKPEHFLSKLIWVERKRTQAFLHDFSDAQRSITPFLLNDPHACILRLSDRWLLDLHARWVDSPDTLAADAARLSACSDNITRLLAARDVRARVVELSLATVLQSGPEAAHVAENLPARLHSVSLLTSASLPKGFITFLEALGKTDSAPSGLGDLLREARAFENTAKVLRRKT